MKQGELSKVADKVSNLKKSPKVEEISMVADKGSNLKKNLEVKEISTVADKASNLKKNPLASEKVEDKPEREEIKTKGELERKTKIITQIYILTLGKSG